MGKIPGRRPVKAVTETREQFTMHPIVDLNGDWGASAHLHAPTRNSLSLALSLALSSPPYMRTHAIP